MADKARYWCAVMYPESMIDDWKETIGDLLEYPYEYCVHDKDTDKKGVLRKEHVHINLVFPNTTTYNHALKAFQRLGDINTCQRVMSIRHAHDYLIHDTDSARKQGKHQYDVSERVSGNNFDIGAYEQLGVADKQAIIDSICKIIEVNNFMDFYELNMYIIDNCDLEYKQVFRSHQGYFSNLVRGKYLHWKRANGLDDELIARGKMKPER